MESLYLYKKRIPFLDFARCMATIQIVLFHYVCSTQLSDRYVLLWGREGVAIFFMISGCGLVNRYYYKLSLKDFYKRRFIGIMLPFYIAYICIMMWKYFWNGMVIMPTGIPVRNIIITLAGMDGLIGVYGVPTFYQIGEWYLGVMIIVYLLFPIWLMFFRKYPKSLTIGLLILRIGIIYNNIFEPLPVCFNPIVAFSNFSIGACIVLALSKNNVFKAKKIIALFGMIMLLVGETIGHVWNWQDFGELLAGIGLFTIYIYISSLSRTFSEGIIVRFVCFISYEIFLVHHVVIYNMVSVINENYSAKCFIFGGCIVFITIISVAYLLKKVVDYMCSNIGDRFSR